MAAFAEIRMCNAEAKPEARDFVQNAGLEVHNLHAGTPKLPFFSQGSRCAICVRRRA
jgi:hypothetical protein